MSSSVGAMEEKLEKLQSDARRGEWPEVFELFKQERALRTAKITGTEDTVLHMAVSNGEEKVVVNMVDFLVREEKTPKVHNTMAGHGEQSLNVNIVLGAENDRKNTPLHFAATKGSVEMCKKIGGADPSLISHRNIAGETPLFLAALYGRKEAFLWLHYLYMESSRISSTDFAHCIRDNDDTILHCAIAEGHFDVAIEIIHIYKDLVGGMRRNKEGLSPLHLLAADRSAFKSTGILELSIFSHPIYRFLRVKNKKQATTTKELEQREREREHCVRNIAYALFNKYVSWFFRVKKKKQGTSTKELEQHEYEPCVRDLTHALFNKYVSWLSRVKKKQQAVIWDDLEECEREPFVGYVSNRGKEEECSLDINVGLLGHILAFCLLSLLLVPVDLSASTGRWFRQIRKMKKKHTWSLQIMNELLQHASDEDMSQIISRTACEQLSISLQTEEDIESESMGTSASGIITIETPLMIAAKNGVTEMVKEILNLFPSRIKDVNVEGNNIVLLAVEYRQTEVFRFLCKQKSESLFRQVDKEGNNVLHLAARLGVDRDWLNPGEALSMSREIKWFEFVKNSMPRGLLDKYNKKMEIPDDIFKESHKELMKSEGEWAVETSQACSVLSTLVASVAFGTCTSAPGGYDEKGYAILRNVRVFKIFEQSSIVALFFSLISTICFLSIVASPSQSVHSWRYVPFKLYSGMCSMFYSLVCLWISFCAGNFFVVDDDRQKLHKALPIYIVLSLAIILFVAAQLPTFIGPTLSSIRTIPYPRRKATRPIEYRRTKNKENSADLNPQN